MVREVKAITVVGQDGTTRRAIRLLPPPAWVFGKADGRARVRRPVLVPAPEKRS